MEEYQWSDNYIKIEHMTETEQETVERTWQVFGGNGFIKMRNLINLFLRLACFISEKTTPASDDYWFQQIAYATYLRLPYNFKSIFDLWAKGYYLEAGFIVRHVIESFAQLRYFHNHRDQIKEHSLAKSQRQRVKFITMFEDIAPGSYKKVYGGILSHFAQGGIATLMFRREYASPTQGGIDLRLIFNQVFAEYILSQTVGFGYGYLNYADLFFPTTMARIEKNIADKMASFVYEYRNDLDKSKRTPEQQEFFENIVRPFLER